MRTRYLILALALPIVVLGLLTLSHAFNQSRGRTATLEIEGYDPRDLISGHYLIYRIKYPAPPNCAPGQTEGYMCLEPNPSFTAEKPDSCELFIRGNCRNQRFTAGIERYYVPESKAYELERKVRESGAAITFSITPEGHTQVTGLLIEGKVWK